MFYLYIKAEYFSELLNIIKINVLESESIRILWKTAFSPVLILMLFNDYSTINKDKEKRVIISICTTDIHDFGHILLILLIYCDDILLASE